MRPTGVFMVAAALSLTSAAAAGVPAGFTAQSALATRVAFITGKQIAVYCASSDGAWKAEEQTRPNGGGDVLAHATVVGDEISMSPTACVPLLAKLRGRPVSLAMLGASLEVLAHEAEHLAGRVDEGETECAALADVQRLARTGFGIRKAVTMRRVLSGAYSRHRAAIAYSSVYRGPCD